MPAMNTRVQSSKSKKEKNYASIAAEALIKLNAIILQWKRKSSQLKGESKSS